MAERASRLPSTIVLKSVFIFSTIRSPTLQISILLYTAPIFILTLLLDLPVTVGFKLKYSPAE
ncbi:hypothetical protein UUU_05820 [Klebsiella pneumoniae subsp. pneumoniae DSM 30104 = JCM 1662 = NBRC 14940]|nr:hypothetical protein UUU_05820 [Klebsiella pneumoniae subsp. pneumoniae DSM 30104 = JCM 1662 = NBRC 14940]